MGRRSFTDEDDPLEDEDEPRIQQATGTFLSPGLAELATFPEEHAAFHRKRDTHLAKAMKIEHASLLALEKRVRLLVVLVCVQWALCALLGAVVVIR